MPQNKIFRNGQVPRPLGFNIEEWFDFCDRWYTITDHLKKKIRKNPEIGKIKIALASDCKGKEDDCDSDYTY